MRHPTSRAPVVVVFAISAVFVILAFVAACAPARVADGFGRVAPGMSRDEVVAILGEPSSRWALVEARDGLDGERLQWGDSLSSLASGAAFRGAPERAWSVIFDAGGSVVEAVPPRWIDDERAEADELRTRRARRDEDGRMRE
ncbi:MAG: hypothetical protein RI967_683 [Planctomycetota bacterium]|jgi:hypothetical protein